MLLRLVPFVESNYNLIELGPRETGKTYTFRNTSNRGFVISGGGANATPARFTIQLEDGFSPEVTQRLRELGYDLSFISMRGELREGYGAAVAIDGRKVTAGADPRRAGAAGAIP